MPTRRSTRSIAHSLKLWKFSVNLHWWEILSVLFLGIPRSRARTRSKRDWLGLARIGCRYVRAYHRQLPMQSQYRCGHRMNERRKRRRGNRSEAKEKQYYAIIKWKLKEIVSSSSFGFDCGCRCFRAVFFVVLLLAMFSSLMGCICFSKITTKLQ